jgi:signal transduction histidine kinase
VAREGDERLIPERVLADLTHDLRTPLTIVTGFADLLARRPDMPEEQRREFIERIAEAARDMVAMLDAERAARAGQGG